VAAVTAKVLGIPKQTLENWVRLDSKGKLNGAGDKPVSAEQMELARLRAELARVKMERDIGCSLNYRSVCLEDGDHFSLPAKAQVIEMLALHAQIDLDVAQRFAGGQLREDCIFNVILIFSLCQKHQ